MAGSKGDLFPLEQLNEGFGFWIRATRSIAHVKSPFQDIELLDTVSCHHHTRCGLRS